MEHLYRRRRDAFGESEVSEFVRPVVGVPEVKPAGPQWMMLPRPGESERERGRARVAPRTDMMTYLYCISGPTLLRLLASEETNVSKASWRHWYFTIVSLTNT